MISEERTVMEAHQRYLAIQNGQKAYYEREMAEKDKTIAGQKAMLEDQKVMLEEKEAEIMRLKSIIEGAT
jgi:hypothetical protein